MIFWGTPFFLKKNPGGHAGGLAKRDTITKIGFYMSKIPKCRLETYWANKEVFYMSKIPKCRLETYWANKENIFVLWAHGPWGP